MATFTVDLLTGKIYLFSGNFSGSGSTPTTGSTYPQVNVYTSLPSPGSASGQIYVVRSGSGTYVLNRKPAGFYYSTGAAWRYLGELPSDLFKSTNFQVIDSVDTSKGLMFVTSGISTNTFRKLTIQNSDGTIAYLTDLNTKVDKTAFADYTGTTAPATYLTKVAFSTFTGTTLPANYYNKTQINAYTGATLILLGNKLNTSTFNTFTGTTLPANYYNKTQINTFTGTTLPANYYNKTQINAYTGSTANAINNRLLKSIFDTYTGTTAPNQFASKASALTGATNLGTGAGIYTSISTNKLQLKGLKGAGNINISTDGTSITISGSSSGTASWNTLTGRPAWLTGTTLQAFQTGHTHSYNNLTDKLTAGIGISIINNVISATGGGGSGSTTTTLQLLDTSGGTNINTVAATPIKWTQQIFSGTSLSFTGGSRIYVKANGVYNISYAINVINTDNSVKNIGSVVRKNGDTDITPLSSGSVSIDTTSNASTNTLPQYLVSLSNGDYFQLIGFRIGNSGVANTKANGSWLNIKRIN